ncbi:glycosyltransferase family 2 protein [Chryseobacterium limigenitum]|uniref:Glycosyltransferase involved in cell wall bisynthesis n=1 Tax=Chryseobacterium limigenitum TaxID=1612149 RepID=A0A1K2ISY1_9FLAO|nr:glycosyltransferase [Chryseobacterium limigenitum]SFZ95549.1 Glycosyltransferase involved in cell wall bisynthesis [Chryseobacterium limigenitum]
MKKISILIANYNNGNFFRDCYISLINQTYKNWEVIIVDDASTDNSVDIIKETIKQDKRFQLYENGENKGCGFTKRKCMEYATGEVCGYLDPDDALYPTALEKSIQQYGNNNIVATYSKMMMCDKELSQQKIFGNTKQIYNNLYFFNCPIQFAHFFTFRRETYLKTQGINPDLKSAVDQDLYLKILELGNVKYINEVLYKYRLHSDGISQQSSKQNAKDSFAYVIHDTMKRRGIKTINNQQVPESYKDSEEIFKLLNYQASFLYRLKTKFKLIFKNSNLPIFMYFLNYSIYELL